MITGTEFWSNFHSAQSSAHHATCGTRAGQFAQSLAHRASQRARAEWSLAGCVQCEGSQQICQRALCVLPHAAGRPGLQKGVSEASLARSLRSSLWCPVTLCYSPDAAFRHPSDGNVDIATWLPLARHQRRPMLSRTRRTSSRGEAATTTQREKDIRSVLGIVPI
ncbi:hypothetical protein E2C01_097799 [Portunus trituberculatus]|uniref:Uncharacterized protein n=1 Tax=Portunus trituberculatus TaxID=210409 RepID=A0A5B7K5B7_PORTR|nr:hypothetical protein [Portunus trituberculatus]